MKAVVLFAHGSRDPLWHKPIKTVAQKIEAAQPGVAVRCAYLELTEPSLMQVATELHQLGCSEMTITPLFLGVGKHAREDLPLLIAELRSAFPTLTIRCSPSVGEDDRVLDMLAHVAMHPISSTHE
jgi:sirohydrochlorin cobaltochelatase